MLFDETNDHVLNFIQGAVVVIKIVLQTHKNPFPDHQIKYFVCRLLMPFHAAKCVFTKRGLKAGLFEDMFKLAPEFFFFISKSHMVGGKPDKILFLCNLS